MSAASFRWRESGRLIQSTVASSLWENVQWTFFGHALAHGSVPVPRQRYEETLPATVYGIEKYLGSGLIKGIGPKFAKLIVNRFKERTLEVIEEEPDLLIEVPGIGQVRVERIKRSWSQQKEIKNIMLFLQGHDVSTSHATKIYKTYGNDSIDVVQENPYKLADDIWGIGFKTADTIAEKMGFGHEKFVRLRSGLLYTLNKLAEDGHCFATRENVQWTFFGHALTHGSASVPRRNVAFKGIGIAFG